MISIRDLLHVKAQELAAHDGVNVAYLHFHAAADHLIREVMRERDVRLTPTLETSIAALEQRVGDAVKSGAAEVPMVAATVADTDSSNKGDESEVPMKSGEAEVPLVVAAVTESDSADEGAESAFAVIPENSEDMA